MRHLLCGTSVLCGALALLSPASEAAAVDWTKLLDKDLSQWSTYLSFRHSDAYDGSEPVDTAGKKIEPVGYGKDPAGVFSIREEGGDLVLRVSGEIYGCLFTKQEFSDYRLRLMVRWGTAKWAPRRDKLRDSGILYHSNGPAGVDYWRSWMLAQEFQVMEGHMGDYWSIASSAIDIRAYPPEGTMNAVAGETQPFLSFGAQPSVSGFCLRSENRESRPGEWTELELVAFSGRSLHIVNGHVVMVLQNSRFVTNGAATPLSKGRQGGWSCTWLRRRHSCWSRSGRPPQSGRRALKGLPEVVLDLHQVEARVVELALGSEPDEIGGRG